MSAATEFSNYARVLMFLASLAAGACQPAAQVGQADAAPVDLEPEFDAGMDAGQHDAALLDAGPGPDAEPSHDAQIACDPSASEVGLPRRGPVPAFTAVVGEAAPIFRQLTDAGLTHYPDMPATLVKNDNGMIDVYLSAGNGTYRLQGSSLTDLALSPKDPVLTPSGEKTGADQAYVGVGGVAWCRDHWVMLYHGENHVIVNAAAITTMNRSVSMDDGATFVRDEPPTVVSPAAWPDLSANLKMYGTSAGTLFSFGPYFFMYYLDRSVSGMHLARACRETCGVVGSWRKYHEGTFSKIPANALSGPPYAASGPSTPVVPSASGRWDAHVTVSYNSYLDAYLMVSDTENGFALHASPDGIGWGERLPLLKTILQADSGQGIHIFYPSLVDAETLSRDVTGRKLLLIYAAQLDDTGRRATHRGYVAEVELTREGDSPSMSGLLSLRRYASSAGHYTTTGRAPPGYVLGGTLGSLAANSLPETMPLFECALGNNWQMLSLDANCDGPTNTHLRLTGFVWTSPSTSRSALYRCHTASGDYFCSTDSRCEGASVDQLLGYLVR